MTTKEDIKKEIEKIKSELGIYEYELIYKNRCLVGINYYNMAEWVAKYYGFIK
jgi:hypothetical protein